MRKPEKIVDLILVALCMVAITIAAASYLRASGGGKQQVSTAVIPSVDSIIGTRMAEIPMLLPDGSTRPYSPSLTAVPKLVLFFKSTCSACEENAPNWRDLQHGRARGIQVVAVSNEGAETATRWLTRHGIENARIILPAMPAQLATAWGVTAVPTTLVVGPDGTVLFGRVGALNQADLAQVSATISGHR